MYESKCLAFSSHIRMYARIQCKLAERESPAENSINSPRRLAICCHCSSRVTRYHMVHCGKGNKGTFNESGYIYRGWIDTSMVHTSQLSLQVFHTFLITVTCMRRATSACLIKKGIEPLEKCGRKNVGTRCKREGGSRGAYVNTLVDEVLPRTRSIFLSDCLPRGRRPPHERSSQIVCVTLMSKSDQSMTFVSTSYRARNERG